VGFDGLSEEVHPELGSVVTVSWTQDRAATVWVEFGYDGVALASPARALEPGAHQELLLGVPYGRRIEWRVVADGSASPARQVDNGPLPEGAPALTVHQAADARVDPASPYVFLSLADGYDFGGRWWVWVIDRRGQVVWSTRSRPERVSIHTRVARDGRSLYVDQNSQYAVFDGGAGSSVVQLTIDGAVVHEFATPGEHHPYTDLPDGRLAYAAIDPVESEELRIVDRAGGVTDLWSCGDWLQSLGSYGYCGSNTLNYDPLSDTFLYSLFSVETVVRIDAASAEVQAWYGHLDGAYTFDPPESAFWWQHGGVLTDAGTFLTSSDLSPYGEETVAREYEIDDATHTLREVWSFGVGEGLYGQYSGEAVRLGNGDTLHNYGNLARVREVTPAGEVVWDLEWDSDAIGRTMPIADLYALAPERP
ncbi:MAG: hypothetical protein ABMA64_15010, partial [Myxococcota bacterium]